MSVPPPFSEEQLTWLRSQFATTTTLADPPAEDPPPGNGSSDNGKLNVGGPIVIYVKPNAYPNQAILPTALPGSPACACVRHYCAYVTLVICLNLVYK